jgi:hypothetical protein
MAGLADEGMLYKAKETLRVFAERRPSLRQLWANRSQRFEQAHAILPSTATAGESLSLTLQAWDQCERLVENFDGAFELDATDDEATYPDRIRFPARNGGVATVRDLSFETPGIQYLTLTHIDSGERFVANPVRVTAESPTQRIFWGDIHFHSHLSDGCGKPEDAMRFGRDVMDLDVVACTDHDTMGFFIPPRLQRRRMHRRYFERLQNTADEFDDPGEFVALFGYEWTKQPNVGGHINVYFDDTEGAKLYDSISEGSNTYEKLFERLRAFNDADGTQALAIPHHTAEGTYPFDFASTDYDDEIAPMAEVYSQWGSSERPGKDGNRHPILMGQGEAEEPGHYIRDALRMGYRTGLMGSSDFHGPRPGHSLLHADPHLPSLSEWRRGGLGWGNIWRIWNEPSYPGGLTAFRAPELTREAVFESLRSRRVYATSQPHRILLEFSVDGVSVGQQDSTVTVDAADAPREISIDVAGTAPIARATVVKNNEAWRTFEGTDDTEADLEAYTLQQAWTDDEPVAGMAWDDDRESAADVYYLRLRQADGGMAWAGPLWVEVAGA